ncbi:hypothetical protein TNCV_1936501 [Trichonephila clavipes]|nr:hypothetical protein TNCV_1936501 [Trichonephila clavipes]
METLESPSWAETPLQFISRHQPEGLAALAVDESEFVVVMDTLWFRYPLVAQWETRVMVALVECKIMDVSYVTMDPWYQRLWKSITSIFRIGEKESFTLVNMIECMDENEESVKDSIDSAKAEPESILETRKRNERFKCDNPEDILGVEPEEIMSDTESESDLYSDSDSESDSESDSIPVLEFIPNTVDRLIEDMLQSRH